jgi:uncharacterized membrane protein
MYLWFAVAAVSAVLFRSSVVAAVAGFLAWASFAVYLHATDMRWMRFDAWMPPVMALAVIGLVRYTRADRARHLAYLLLVGWLAWLYTLDSDLRLASLYAAGGMAALVVVSLPASPLSGLVRSAGAAPAFYAFLVAVIGLLFLHIEFDQGGPLIVLGLVTLAAAILAIALQGRDNGSVRYLAYTAFSVEILFLASVTVGSILGTSGLFLCSGMFVAVLAWLVIRLERRFAGKAGEASL